MSIFFAVKLDKDDYSAYYAFGRPGLTSYKRQTGQSQGSVFPWLYLLPLLLPAGGFLSWRRGPPVTKPAAGWLDTPKVRPAEGLRPGLLKLKPEVLLLPKPRKVRDRRDGGKY